MSASNPKAAAGKRKPQLRLVPPALVIHTAMAMADGAAKYGPYNFRDVDVSLTDYLEAAWRHLLALMDGENHARDSQQHHAGHIAACMGIILDCLERGNLVDDRPTTGPAADLLETFTQRLDEKFTSDDGESVDEPVPYVITGAFGELP